MQLSNVLAFRVMQSGRHRVTGRPAHLSDLLHSGLMTNLTTEATFGQQPSAAYAPTPQKERHFILDVLRGFALLGILLANIESFGTPEATHDIPLGMAIPAFEGPHATLNLVLVILKWIFVEG